ncbi:diguanylate cyclase (GGDEF) domain protein [Leptospira weilii serovar Ranarum str. ICFT]|uniref:diguanylate cyclase n=1 Tax=Leptospira weilii serovar Ranarum str. ICFT TaxID=1218598 RepID=N1WT37_9LEPT|nr:sensor domain-containing diguanylate cyclase [Leptospira weilii]EMY78983.1 diguanylate cyclase (GGDEF) domain protein [Leptospira weilii serovar Ranarum str. ICFT]
MNYENEFNLEKFFNYSLDLFAIQRMDGTVIEVNPSFQRVLGWSKEELIGRSTFHLLHPEELESIQHELETSDPKAPKSSVQSRVRCSDGNYKYFEWTGFPDLEAGLVYMTGRDITETIESNRKISQLAVELQEANEMLFEQASTDPLTKLKNRRAFNEELSYLIKLAQRQENFLSLLMLDVDHFKDYNDRFGHPAGDRVLADLASLLTRTLRGSDVLARYGGEEFIIALPNTSEDKAMELAEKLVTVTREFVWEKRSVTVSVGVTTENFNKTTQIKKLDYSTSLIENADKALYRSKTNGRNRATHSSQIH